MNKTIVHTVKIGAIALALLSSTACVTSKQLEEVRAQAQAADQKAAAAQSAANAASSGGTSAASTANEAKRAAEAAQSTANQALQAAQAAQAAVDAQNEKIDRMFKKSVSK